MEKPEKLYRGIHFNYDEFKAFDMTADLIVPYEPYIDEYGRKTVHDGNEYGVYMTDELHLAKDVYGNLRSLGEKLYPNIIFKDSRYYIGLGEVGIIYEINPNQIEIRKPFIRDALRGHYNNGYKGDEWIADRVPLSSAKIIRIRIGEDILHPAEDIPLTGNPNIDKENVLHILDLRRLHLDTFAQELMKISLEKISSMELSTINLYRDIFGKDGYNYIKEEDIDTTYFDGLLKALSYYVYHNDTNNIDFSTLKYLKSIERKLAHVSEEDKIESLVQFLINDISLIEEKLNNLKLESSSDSKLNFFEEKIKIRRSLLKKIQELLNKNLFLNSISQQDGSKKM